MELLDRELGFDGRMFLTEQEWSTYRRRNPVRYIHHAKDRTCYVCRKPATDDNPMQNAHRISFKLGITRLALTPEYLDRKDNIVTTHRKICNKKAELDLPRSMKLLQDRGITELPAFLPLQIHEDWLRTKSS